MKDEQSYLIAIFGKVCSGKNTYATKNYPRAQIIDIGDVVRHITQTQDRTHDTSLDTQIIEYLRNEIYYSRANTNTTVIVGIRQLSILKALEEIISEFPTENLERVWLEVPEGILKARYINRAAKKDSCLDFEAAIKRDSLLGLDESIEYLRTVKTTVIENYNRNEDYTL